MEVFTVPDNTYPGTSDLLLAGDTEGSDWQSEVLNMLSDEDVIVLNSRLPKKSKSEDAEAQTVWQESAMATVDTVIFWFPADTTGVSTLLELRSIDQYMGVQKQLLVGCHPDFMRRDQLISEMQDIRPDTTIYVDLQTLVFDYLKGR